MLNLEKRFENICVGDISLIKLAVLFATLWIIGLFPNMIYFLEEWRWAFFSLAIIFGVIPTYKFWFKKNKILRTKRK